MYTMKEKIGIKLLYLCALNDMPVKKLSDISSVSEKVINNIICGEKKHLNTNTLNKVIVHFNMTLGDFFEDPLFKD